MPALTIARLPREDSADPVPPGTPDYDWTAYIPDANLYFPFAGGTEAAQVANMKLFADYIHLLSGDTPQLAAQLQHVMDLDGLEGANVNEVLFAGTDGLDFIAVDGTVTAVWAAADDSETLLANLATAGADLDTLLAAIF